MADIKIYGALTCASGDRLTNAKEIRDDGMKTAMGASQSPTQADINEYLDKVALEAAGSSMYDPADDTQVVPTAIGGIVEGTKATDLTGKTMSEMFDLLLYPTLYPTFTAPSVTITPNASKTLEVGAAFPFTASSFTVSYNAGAITLNGVKQADRAGAKTATAWSVGGSSTWPTTVVKGTTAINATVSYAAGTQPKDSKGNAYSTALAAGKVTSNTVNVYGGYVVVAGSSTKGTIAAGDMATLRSGGKASSVVTGSSMPSVNLAVAHTAAAYTWLCIPSTITNFDVSKLKDGSGFGYSMSGTVVSLTYNGITYKCYRSNAMQVAGTQNFVY